MENTTDCSISNSACATESLSLESESKMICAHAQLCVAEARALMARLDLLELKESQPHLCLPPTLPARDHRPHV